MSGLMFWRFEYVCDVENFSQRKHSTTYTSPTAPQSQ